MTAKSYYFSQSALTCSWNRDWWRGDLIQWPQSDIEKGLFFTLFACQDAFCPDYQGNVIEGHEPSLEVSWVTTTTIRKWWDDFGAFVDGWCEMVWRPSWAIIRRLSEHCDYGRIVVVIRFKEQVGFPSSTRMRPVTFYMLVYLPLAKWDESVALLAICETDQCRLRVAWTGSWYRNVSMAWKEGHSNGEAVRHSPSSHRTINCHVSLLQLHL